MRLIDHVYDDQLLEQATVRIVLPEHARDIEFYPPTFVTDVKRLANERHYTYLDTVGRPVIVLSKRDALFQHIQDFELHYTFDKIMLFHEPMLIVIPLFVLFCLVIVLVRLNFAISHNEGHEVRTRLQGVWHEVIEHNLKRTSFYQKIDDALNNYKANKDLKIYTELRKKFDNELKLIQQDVSAIHKRIEAEHAESAEQIAEFQRLDAQQREVTQLLSGHAEKFVTGKVQKQVYAEQEQTLRSRLREINTRVSEILHQY